MHFKVFYILHAVLCTTSPSLRRKPRFVEVLSLANGVAQTGIMAADLANNYKQTEIMQKRLRQDFELAMLQMQQAKKSSEDIVNALSTIESRLGDISNKLDQIGGHISIGLQTIFHRLIWRNY